MGCNTHKGRKEKNNKICGNIEKIYTKFMKKLLTLLPILLIFSCKLTKNKAIKQINKIEQYQPVVLAEKCSKTYPAIDSVIQNTIYLPGTVTYDTVNIQANCDSLKRIKPKDSLIYIHLPVKHITDTIVTKEKTVKTNKAQEFILTHIVDSLKTNTIHLNTKIASKNKQVTILAIIVIIFLLITALKIYLKIKK